MYIYLFQELEREAKLIEEQANILNEQQREKYGEMHEIPSELTECIASLREAEKALNARLHQREQELQQAEETCVQYGQTLKLVNTWMAEAEGQLSEDIQEVDVSRDKHQQLLGEFELFKLKMANLQEVGDQLGNQTSSPEGKARIQEEISHANQRWADLQTRSEKMSQDLQEAAELWVDFDNCLHFVTSWLEKTESVVTTELVFTSFDRVQVQLQDHRVGYDFWQIDILNGINSGSCPLTFVAIKLVTV